MEIHNKTTVENPITRTNGDMASKHMPDIYMLANAGKRRTIRDCCAGEQLLKYTSNREGKLFSIDCDMRRGTRNPIVKELSLRGSENKQNTLFLFVEVWKGLKSARIYTERRNTQETLHRNRSRVVEREVLLARKVELLHLRHIFVLHQPLPLLSIVTVRGL